MHTLFPKYELALGKRGSINFTSNDAELFFNLNKKDEYEKYVSNKLKGYNYPFGTKKEESPCLFNLVE